LSQSIDKAGEQDDRAAAALEKVIEVLLSLRVDLELVQRSAATPAAYHIT
jgi:hypothetical protein